MSKPQATTLPVTVKVVRECANKTLTNQRRFVDTDLRKIAERYNHEVDTHNSSWVTGLFRLKLKTHVEVDTVIEDWKKLWLTGDMSGDHIAYRALWVARTAWWKRLKQLSALPEADDDKLMQVSVEDLDLIDYNIWMKAEVQS